MKYFTSAGIMIFLLLAAAHLAAQQDSIVVAKDGPTGTQLIITKQPGMQSTTTTVQEPQQATGYHEATGYHGRAS